MLAISRRQLLIDNFNSSEEEKVRALDVYKLNVSEIQIYTELIETFKENINLLQCSTKHHLHYDENHGSVIMVDFVDNYDDIMCFVPISMLSVLEANAYANEILIKIKGYDRNEAPRPKGARYLHPSKFNFP